MTTIASRHPAQNHQASHSTGHPLLGDRIPLAGTKEQRFQVCLSPHAPAYLADHQIWDTVVLPGAAYVEMVIATSLLWQDSYPVTLSSFTIDQPLRFPEKFSGNESNAVVLQLVSSPTEDSDKKTIQVFSFNHPGKGKSDAEICHATATVIMTAPSPSLDLPDLNTLQAKLKSYSVSIEDYYVLLQQQGLCYGDRFQTIQQLYQQEGQALSYFQVSEEDSSESLVYHLHPVLLDACFQTIGAAVQASSSSGTYLPIGFDQLQVYRPLGTSGWCHVQFDQANFDQANVDNPNGTKQKTLKANLTIWDETGAIAAHIHAMTLRYISHPALRQLLKIIEESSHPWLYEMAWQPQPNHQPEPVKTYPNWLIFADAGEVGLSIASALYKRGDRPILVTPGDSYTASLNQPYQLNPASLNPVSPDDFQNLLEDLIPDLITDEGYPACQILYLWGLDMDETASDMLREQRQGLGSLLYLVQAVAQCPALHAKLWLITQTTQTVDVPISLHSQQSTLWGFARTLRLEHPNLPCICVDLPPSLNPETLELLLTDLYTPDKENQIAYRQGDRFVARLFSYSSSDSPQRLALPDAEAFRLGITDYGVLDHLTLMPIQRRSPQPGEVEIQVKASGLNFRDVLNALGMLTPVLESMGFMHPSDVPFGGECAGTVTAVGKDVKHLQVGDAVIAAQAVGSLSQFVTVPADFVVPKPPSMSFAEAATVPTTFLTAYYGLIALAKLNSKSHDKNGTRKRILIHAAAGGVGQAAVQIAQWLGVEVFATASLGKWEMLRSMGIQHIMNSRTLDFADEVLAKTNGQGVDIVFNSLNGEAIANSLKTLASNGIFVEIGKIGIWDQAKMTQHRPDVTYLPDRKSVV